MLRKAQKKLAALASDSQGTSKTPAVSFRLTVVVNSIDFVLLDKKW
jgi:hypothetical protein